ncbi:MAG: hypothetical protein L0207_01720 [Chlamydiae bacterium]|nr:hypothetical protein [Chlamydiota bacterium]
MAKQDKNKSNKPFSSQTSISSQAPSATMKDKKKNPQEKDKMKKMGSSGCC